MRHTGMSNIGRGLRRRGRLMAQAVAPPRRSPAARAGKAAVSAVSAVTVVSSADGVDGAPCRAADYVAPSAPRLVESPVFVLSSVRSGSTLLRVLLNSHTRIRAPHEMHLRTLHVHLAREFTAAAMKGLELDKDELEHVLWDRLLHLELSRSGKDVIVDKTPPNTLMWPRLHRCWPGARYVILLRHPAAVVTSLARRRTDPDLGQIHAEVLDYSEKLEEARHHLHAPVITYEELTAEPEKVTRGLCDHLGVPWESSMLDYGRQDHGSFQPQLGDWSGAIRSGRIQRARGADPGTDLPPRLAQIARAWGYPVG